jgi:hypothetical protein
VTRTERRELTAGVSGNALPIDVATIAATINRALRENAGRLDLSGLAEREEVLRGHIDLLLPEARDARGRLWHGSIEWHRRTVRLDGVERQARRGLRGGPLPAHIQVQQLARDCQWLLNQHTAGTR